MEKNGTRSEEIINERLALRDDIGPRKRKEMMKSRPAKIQLVALPRRYARRKHNGQERKTKIRQRRRDKEY
jgi:hypothetical protein